MSDTPRTDKEIVGELLVFASFARKLERELSAVTEERDELKSKYRTHHDEAERITNEIRRVSSVCRELREQRDRLAEAADNMLQAVRGLAAGEDWNEGTHAKLHGYRQRVLDCRSPLAKALAAVKGGSDE